LLCSFCFEQKKEIEKKKKARDKEAQKQINAALKQHKKNQTKATRKAMKRNKRKAGRVNDNKGEFFISRWYKNLIYPNRR